MFKNILSISRNYFIIALTKLNSEKKQKRLIREIKPLFYLYQIYNYIIYLPILGLDTTIIGFSGALFMSIHEKYGRYFAWTWARINAYLTPITVKTYGFENIDKNQSYVIVANHQSQFDIFVIYGWLPIDFRWVMKIQLRKTPALGYFCYKAGHVFIDRSNPDAAKESINSAKNRITGGTSITFFPEGKRSETGELDEFKKGAFKFAIDMGLPILPVTIIGTRNVLPANSMSLFPGKTKMIVHKPVSIEGYSDENIYELIDESKKAIQSGIDNYKL